MAAPIIVQLEWEHLIPATSRQAVVRGVVQHGADLGPGLDGNAVVAELDGEVVRLAGFIVPLEFDGHLVKEFLLAPYAGACIHVPPPPANQLVYVVASKGFRLDSLTDAVVVTGTMKVAAIATELAPAGYTVVASRVDAYRF
jgi:hypothetical protein